MLLSLFSLEKHQTLHISFVLTLEGWYLGKYIEWIGLLKAEESVAVIKFPHLLARKGTTKAQRLSAPCCICLLATHANFIEWYVGGDGMRIVKRRELEWLWDARRAPASFYPQLPYPPLLPLVVDDFLAGDVSDGDDSVGDEPILQEDDEQRSFQATLQLFLATSRFGAMVMWTNLTLSLVLPGMYVWLTYQDLTKGIPTWFSVTMIVITAALALRIILHIAASQKPLEFFLAPRHLIDLISLLPVFTLFWTASVAVEVQLIRLLWLARVYQLHVLRRLFQSEVHDQLFTMAVNILQIILFAAGVFNVTENYEPWWPDTALLSESHLVPDGISYFNSMYFVIITVTTVGYGDIFPVTSLGRVTTTLTIAFSFWVLTADTNRLVTLLSRQSIYVSKSYHPPANTAHVVVCGAVGAMKRGSFLGGADHVEEGEGEGSAESIIAFFKEFFHDDHGSGGRSVVVLAKGPPSPQLAVLMDRPKYSIGITYLDGDVMVERDLRRAAVGHARGVFVLSNRHALDADAEDSSTILRALAVKRYAFETNGRDLLAFVQVIRPENVALFRSATNSTFGGDDLSNQASEYGSRGPASMHLHRAYTSAALEFQPQQASPQFAWSAACAKYLCCASPLRGTRVTPDGRGAGSEDAGRANGSGMFFHPPPLTSQGTHAGFAVSQLASSAPVSICVSIEEVKYNMMAASCLSPGILTLLYNLVVSDSNEADEVPAEDLTTSPRGGSTEIGARKAGEQGKRSRRKLAMDDLRVNWKQEYESGCQFEIYRVGLSPAFQGVSFQHAVEIVYQQVGIILFGLEMTPPELDRPYVVLNPGAYVLPGIAMNRVYGFVIAKDKKEADQLTVLGVPARKRGGRRASGAIRRRGSVDMQQRVHRPSFLGSPTGGGAGAAQTRTQSQTQTQTGTGTEDDLASLASNAGRRDSQASAALLFSAARRRVGERKRRGSITSDKEALQKELRESRKEEEEGKSPSYESVGSGADGEGNGSGEGAAIIDDDVADREVWRIAHASAKRRKELRRSVVHADTAHRSFEECKIRSVDEPGEGYVPIESHIVVLGARESTDLYHFIRPLREGHLIDHPAIVILSSSPPSQRRWARISVFDQIFFMDGSATQVRDLLRAGVDRAGAVVVFGSSMKDKANSSTTIVDADTIVTYRIIRTISPTVDVIVELDRDSSIPFLSIRGADATPTLCTPFLAGHVFTSAFTDTLLCQAFFNPFVVNILQLMIGGSDRATAHKWRTRVSKRLGKVHESHSFLIPLPTALVGSTFETTFLKLLTECSIIVIGVRRGATVNRFESRDYYDGEVDEMSMRSRATSVHSIHDDDDDDVVADIPSPLKDRNSDDGSSNTLPYTFTNPSPTSVLRVGDCLFVLAQRSPTRTFLRRHFAPASEMPRLATIGDIQRARNETGRSESVATVATDRPAADPSPAIPFIAAPLPSSPGGSRRASVASALAAPPLPRVSSHTSSTSSTSSSPVGSINGGKERDILDEAEDALSQG